jgi:hypothetical protein
MKLVAEESDLTIDGADKVIMKCILAITVGRVLWKLKVFLEVNSLQNIFCCYKDSNLHPNIKSISRFHF